MAGYTNLHNLLLAKFIIVQASRLRSFDGGMAIASLYFATVLLATLIP